MKIWTGTRTRKFSVNATPLGMYPENGTSPVDLACFDAPEGVLDVVYNPARTALMLQAEALSVPHASGLSMLVAQAKKACEYFTDTEIPDTEIDRIERLLSHQMQNIVLIGMARAAARAPSGRRWQTRSTVRLSTRTQKLSAARAAPFLKFLQRTASPASGSLNLRFWPISERHPEPSSQPAAAA